MALNEYQRRRRDLACRLPESAVAIIPAASECLRNGDSHYRFRQDSDFYYLTGFNEPDALLIISGGKNSTSILFNRPRDKMAETWTGRRLGQDDAVSMLGVDLAYSVDELDVRLVDFLVEKQAIYYPLGRYPQCAARIFNAWQLVKARARRGVSAPHAFCDIAPLLGEMRLFKTEAELQCMRKAITISVAAHKLAMQRSPHCQFEYQLEAEILYELFRQGCQSVAYPSIVAGGANACVLHYTDNNQALRPGELVLIDAGGEFEGYAADITRTFPSNGHFSSEQALIYDLVLGAQTAGMACIRPGQTWDAIQAAVVQHLTAGLLELGILRGKVEVLIEQAAYKPFYMHQSGHWLGLDVHDVGAYTDNGTWRKLEPGMVLTVEPGIYISPGMEHVDERWWGIGIRIEDDVLVTAKGFENLSQDLPVERDAIEAIIRA